MRKNINNCSFERGGGPIQIARLLKRVFFDFGLDLHGFAKGAAIKDEDAIHARNKHRERKAGRQA